MTRHPAGDPITVVGGGIFGLACAVTLAQRGAGVRLVERDRIGAGSSGGHVGALAPHVPEQWNDKKQVQLDSLLAAGAFWAEVAQAGGRDPGYACSGRVQPLPDDQAVARAHDRAAGAADLWQGRAEWRVLARKDLAPHLPEGLIPPSPTGLYVFDTLSARISPRAAGQALAAALRALGGRIDIDPDFPEAPRPGMGRTLWATGAAGLDALSRQIGRPVGAGIKGQSALLAHTAPSSAQVFVDGLHIVPHADGTTAIGSTTERDFADLATDARLEDLIVRARAACPALADAPVIDRWAGARPRARSRAPMLGDWPGHPGHVIANGGFKIGVGMAPGVAAMIADLMLDGHDRIPADFRVAASL
ncbi:NAD(P)/FAD-dependent oxidoreductase [Paracoccus sp. p3-h83]|uniref:NAD(P)/FAD-dependent oxidoreductase n=1 Tax=Paracoccus sp. p3-h83 TaxID=3342805 RepID=UPI0035B9BE92